MRNDNKPQICGCFDDPVEDRLRMREVMDNGCILLSIFTLHSLDGDGYGQIDL